jgi:hypothetical protein
LCPTFRSPSAEPTSTLVTGIHKGVYAGSRNVVKKSAVGGCIGAAGAGALGLPVGAGCAVGNLAAIGGSELVARALSKEKRIDLVRR